jgi:hypothetical protein
MIRCLHRIIRDERGLTLPELIVVSLVTTMLLIAVGGIYLSTIRVQRTVSALTGSANSAQLLVRSVDTGVRNGVKLLPIAVGGDGGQLLAVCTVGADEGNVNEYFWQAWYYSPEGEGQVRTQRFDPTAPPAVPTAAQLAQWTQLLDGLEPLLVDPATPTAAPDRIFDVNNSTVAIGFYALGENADSATIELATHLAPHPSAAPGSEKCT